MFNKDYYSCCIAEKNNNADVKKMIYFFSFLFITRNVQRERERERERERVGDGWNTEATVRFFFRTSLLFCFVLYFCETYTGSSQGFKSSQFSAFASLVLGHHRASNHLNFFLLLNPWQSGERTKPRAVFRCLPCPPSSLMVI